MGAADNLMLKLGELSPTMQTNILWDRAYITTDPQAIKVCLSPFSYLQHSVIALSDLVSFSQSILATDFANYVKGAWGRSKADFRLLIAAWFYRAQERHLTDTCAPCWARASSTQTVRAVSVPICDPLRREADLFDLPQVTCGSACAFS